MILRILMISKNIRNNINNDIFCIKNSKIKSQNILNITGLAQNI